jgi:hypothetical protein
MTEWLDESTLGLLFGMMIIVGQLQRTGLFEVACAAALHACRGHMWLLTVLVLTLTGERARARGRGARRGWGLREGGRSGLPARIHLSRGAQLAQWLGRAAAAASRPLGLLGRAASQGGFGGGGKGRAPAPPAGPSCRQRGPSCRP